jgi:hypothetical protein
MKTLQQHVPKLYKLALESRQAEISVLDAKTPRSISKTASEKLIADTKLIEHLNKLSSAVLESLSSNKDKDELEKKIKKYKKKEEAADKTAGLTPSRALALSAGLSLPAGLTAAALLNEADDKIDARIAAIPGVAAATVAAIMAAKNMGKKDIVKNAEGLKELSDAIKVSFVVKNLKNSHEFSKVAGELEIANKRHISALVNDLLFG